jgi:hypothetical protein
MTINLEPPVGVLPTNTAQQNGQAWNDAMAALDPALKTGGARWIFPPGKYYFDRTLDIRRQMIIEGLAGIDSANGVFFIWTSDLGDNPGIYIHGYGDGQGDGRNSVIRHIRMQGTGTDSGLINSHGILVKMPVVLEHVLIQYFGGHGAAVIANSGAQENANKWFMNNVSVSQCGGCGIYINGPDANAGLCIGANVNDNRGAGIWDDSFLGNFYLGCQADSNQSNGSGGLPTAYRTTSATGMSVFIGCYAEAPQKIDVNHPAMFLGGIADNDGQIAGNGITLWRDIVYGRALSFVVNSRRDKVFSKTIGFRSIGGDAAGLVGSFNFPADVDPTNRNLSLNDVFTGLYDEDGDRVTRALGLGIPNTTAGNAPIWFSTPNSIICPVLKWAPADRLPVMSYGLFVGAVKVIGPFANSFQYSLSGPQYAQTTFYKGALSLESFFDEGGYSMFRCTESGTSGSYSEGYTATADGSTSLILSAPSLALRRGMILKINGVGPNRINHINGTEMEMNLPVVSGVGLSIEYYNPSFVPFAEITGGVPDTTMTPGNTTQNTLKGRVAIPAGQSSVIVTNDKVTENSLVFAQLQTSDTGLTQISAVVPAAGNFTVYGNAAAVNKVNVCWYLKE